MASGSLAREVKKCIPKKGIVTALSIHRMVISVAAGFEGPEPRERDHLEPYLIELPESADGETHDSLQKQDWVR